MSKFYRTAIELYTKFYEDTPTRGVSCWGVGQGIMGTLAGVGQRR